MVWYWGGVRGQQSFSWMHWSQNMTGLWIANDGHRYWIDITNERKNWSLLYNGGTSHLYPIIRPRKYLFCPFCYNSSIQSWFYQQSWLFYIYLWQKIEELYILYRRKWKKIGGAEENAARLFYRFKI
jgi:hypothetical protein